MCSLQSEEEPEEPQPYWFAFFLCHGSHAQVCLLELNLPFFLYNWHGNSGKLQLGSKRSKFAVIFWKQGVPVKIAKPWS